MKWIKVSYEDYVKGICAVTTVDAMKKKIGTRHCCMGDICAMLGVEAEEVAQDGV